MSSINIYYSDLRDDIKGDRRMLEHEEWFKNQTENILNGIDNRNEEMKESDKRWEEIKRAYQRDIKETYIKSLKPFDIEEEPEEEINERIKEFAYSDINPYKSERVMKRIDRELREAIKRESIAKENEKTKLFWLFSFLFGKNENKDIVKKYKKEERERIKRVRIFQEREMKRTKDKTPIKHYDYTVSTAKFREDRNIGANHNTSKRTLKQIDIKEMQLKALKKTHKILRELKKKNVDKNFLKSVTVFAGEVISDSDPGEVMPILSELQKDVFKVDTREEENTDIENLKRYMDYSNRLENLRSYGISYKNLIAKDKREVKEMRKLKEIGSEN